MDNNTSEQNRQSRQEYRKRSLIYRLLAYVAFGLSLLSTHIANKFTVGSSARGIFLGVGALFLISTFCCFYADRWNRFQSERTDKGARAFLFFNRIGEGFYSVMIALAGFISAGAGYFLKKKSRLEQNQLLILERMEEMKAESHEASDRIETKLSSLSSDLEDNAAILAAIKEDNEATLARHIEREEQLKAEIAEIKARIESLQVSGVNHQAEVVSQLENKLEETKADLTDEQNRIDRLEQEKANLTEESVSNLAFKDLLTRLSIQKSDPLEKMAREIAEASKDDHLEYLYELGRFYRAMVDLGYLRENASRFALFFHKDYGKGRNYKAYRRSFSNAVKRLLPHEYEEIKEEIREIVTK